MGNICHLFFTEPARSLLPKSCVCGFLKVPLELSLEVPSVPTMGLRSAPGLCERKNYLKQLRIFFPPSRTTTGQGSVYLVESEGPWEEDALWGNSFRTFSE